jgi:chemotaxis protein MotB
MKRLHLFLILTPLLFIVSCVSSKKYKSLDATYKKEKNGQAICIDELKSAKSLNTDLYNQKVLLSAEIEYLKKNSTEVLNALQDMSVLSAKQAESVKQSLENISQKDAYIRNLQSAISRKDSLNMILVMNLKSSLGDINDKDVTIKVEKGVVYIEISDKMLFNFGKYAVTENAKVILGKVAKVLNAYPDIEFLVEGHTDTIPIHNACMEDNWDLSVKRATSVVRILEKEYKMNPSRMTASGHGAYAPIAPNNLDEGRAQNRRTRIIILPELDQFFKLLVTKK